MSLQFTSISLSMTVVVPEAALEQHIAASPSIVSEEIVAAVKEYEKAHKLGYFPAIDFYINNNGIDPDLLDAMQSISWVVTNMVRNEIRIKMRPVFSNIKFETIQSLAQTLPPVRIKDEKLTQKLMEHFNTTTVKVNLTATLIQKFIDKETAEKLAKNLAYQWLKGSFEKVTVNSSKALD